MADDRTYIRVHDGLDEHAKVAGLSDAAFRLLIESWCFCSRNLTDGRVAHALWKRRGTAKARRELIDAGLVDEHDGHVEMHDYLEHQRSAEEVKLLKQTRGDSGSFGNHVKWHVIRRKAKSDCEFCRKYGIDPIANGSQVRSQTDRKPIASTEAEAEAEVDTSLRGGSHVSSGPPAKPPLYSDRCKRHGDVPEPGPCGDCADVRKAARRLAVVGPANPATVPHCGECDETRHRETPFGVIRCPECHPRAEEAS